MAAVVQYSVDALRRAEISKVGVLQGLFGRDPLDWITFQQILGKNKGKLLVQCTAIHTVLYTRVSR